MKDIKIFVTTETEINLPESESYLPIQIGSEGKDALGYLRDNIGDNISDKKESYAQLTGVYYALKNVDADYYGLVSDNTYFTNKSLLYRYTHDKLDCVLNDSEIEGLINENEILLSNKKHYFISGVKSHYKDTPYMVVLNKVREIIEVKYPEYIEAYDKMLTKNSIHMNNTFIMNQIPFIQYNRWLFKVLKELEPTLEDKDINLNEISELLLEVWLLKTKVLYKEIPVINMEDNKLKIEDIINNEDLSTLYGEIN